MAAQYMIVQSDPGTWQLLTALKSAVWKFAGSFSSEADATAAIGALITQSKWVAPPPKYFDETGTVVAITS